MKKYLNIITLALSITGLSSCLKDDTANLTPDNSPAVVEFSSSNVELPTSSTGTNYALFVRSFERGPEMDVPFDVNYTGGAAAPQDIKVTIGVKPTAIQEYVAERLSKDHITVTGFTVLPSNLYTLPTDVVIKKGERKTTIHVKFNSAGITNFGLKYILPISITAADGAIVSGNFGTILAQLGVKNAYDGVYDLTGTITRYNSGTTNPDLSLGGTYPTNPPLLSAVTTIAANQNTFQLFWRDGGGIAGIDGLNLTVDPATNLVTVTTNPATALANTPGQVNAYDPATKTFKLHFTWGATNKRIANITLKYNKTR